MVVLAFLSDPEVVGRILGHLGLPAMAPVLAAARPSGWVLGFGLAEDSVADRRDEEGDGDSGGWGIPVRPPP